MLVSYYGISKLTIAKMAGVEENDIDRLLVNPPEKVEIEVKYKIDVTVMEGVSQTIIHQFDRMYLFEDINFSTQDEEEKEDTCSKFETLLRSMNVSYKIIVSNHYADNNKLREEILQKAVSKEMEPLAKEYHKMIGERLEEGRGGLLQSKYFVVSCRKPDYESAKTYFNTIEFSIQQLFHRLGSCLIPLDATERLRALHSYYRMGDEASFSFDWNEYLHLKRDWRNDIINTSLREKTEHLEMEGGTCACVMFVRKYHNGLTDQFLNELTNMNFLIIYTMDVEPLDNNVAYQMIMKKYMANERSINREQEMKNKNGDYSTNINYERRKQQRDTEEMLDRISSFDERLLYVGITIVVKANSMEELEERTEKIKIIGQTHNMDIVPHSHKQLDALNTSLPTGARFVDTMRTITSEELSIFIPFNVQEINDNLGYCYGFNKVSKNLIIGNRKLLKNGNGMVFGVPRSRKSYNEKSEMGQVLCFSTDDIIVIDKAVRDMYSEYFQKKNDRRRKRKTRLESPTIRTMRDGIAERSEGNDSAIELIEQLEVFADGTLDIFAREQSISEENRFTVYGFSELGKRMRAMAMLVMIESITAKIKYNQSDGVATWAYVDEMHELWGEEYSLHALEKMWREVRKRGGICTGMSQNLIDAQRNRSTKTRVSNSEFMLLLDQGTMDKEAVEDLFDISAEQLACVNGADPGMGLIRFGDKIVPFDNTMKKDSELYQLFNTTFHEIAGATR